MKNIHNAITNDKRQEFNNIIFLCILKSHLQNNLIISQYYSRYVKNI